MIFACRGPDESDSGDEGDTGGGDEEDGEEEGEGQLPLPLFGGPGG